jgi:hypothetical protein
MVSAEQDKRSASPPRRYACVLDQSYDVGSRPSPPRQSLMVGVAVVEPLVRPLVDVARFRPRVALAEGKQSNRERRLGSARGDELEHEPVCRRAMPTARL